MVRINCTFPIVKRGHCSVLRVDEERRIKAEEEKKCKKSKNKSNVR
jgi:hypothetical protein